MGGTRVIPAEGGPSAARRHRSCGDAMLIDTLGSGLLGPFELLFGHLVAGVPLVAAGVAIAVGTALPVPVGPAAGALGDRVGATRVATLANGVSAAACALLLLAHGALFFGVACFVLAAGSRGFWAVFTPLVVTATGDSGRTWFGRLRSARYIGLTAGQALAGVILGFGTERGRRRSACSPAPRSSGS